MAPSTVSDLNKMICGPIEAWRNRPIEPHPPHLPHGKAAYRFFSNNRVMTPYVPLQLMVRFWFCSIRPSFPINGENLDLIGV